METLTTKGVKISVETAYQESFSKPMEPKFIFAYRITIENKNDFTIQLLRRHWIIKNAKNVIYEVEGEGVIGKQPILKPGEQHQYSSWTSIATEVGKMGGHFLMIRSDTEKSFDVQIPEFKLIVPFIRN